MTDVQIEQLLASEVIARIGCISDGRVYVVPVTYVYDGTYVWGHAMNGAKLAAMRAAPSPGSASRWNTSTTCPTGAV
ncbi:MAG: pyridoxamine 5'-phosphate oxidase family protein [Mycobacterium sp.]|nr:pyridoxamine 5'-phosphate oxidase family protein [Mycobacterium sp.]